MTALIWIELVLSLGAPEIFDPIAMPLLGTVPRERSCGGIKDPMTRAGAQIRSDDIGMPGCHAVRILLVDLEHAVLKQLP
jgi:hypothetical protein